jgi:hypothetical protein
MMNFRKLIAATALALPLAAVACDSVSVTILPFDVVRDFTTSFSALSATNGGVPTFGTVRVDFVATLKGCDVTVGYRNPVLRVARELRSDSCSFDHVLVHEEEHLTIYRTALATLAARIEARATDPNLFKAVVEELDAVKPAHRAHDSDDEYDTNRTACMGRILRLAGLRR